MKTYIVYNPWVIQGMTTAFQVHNGEPNKPTHLICLPFGQTAKLASFLGTRWRTISQLKREVFLYGGMLVKYPYGAVA